MRFSTTVISITTLLNLGCASTYEVETESAQVEPCPPGILCALPPSKQDAPYVPPQQQDAPGSSNGNSATPPPGAAPAPAPSTAPTQPPPPATTNDIPCDAARVLHDACWGCHSTQTQFGAPMALADLESIRAWSPRIVARVNDVQRPMPPPPNTLEANEKTALLGWLAAGAPAGAACAEPLGTPDMDTNPEPPPSEVCDHEVNLIAHGGAPDDENSKFGVPRENDSYTCFVFQAPWNSTVHGLSFRPIIDDSRTLHHWLLYATDDPTKSILGRQRHHGEVYGCNGTNEGLALIAGWAPGGQPTVMPDGVGLEMPQPGGLFVLEVHYHNDQRLDSRDRSGVRICATEDLKPETAAVHWLGEEAGPVGILPFSVPSGSSEVTGQCRPRNMTRPVNIIASLPHMHKRGSRMRTVINRADGGQDILHDQPFDYQNQIQYDTPQVLQPGDTLSTTCFFENPGGRSNFGPSTDDEMCYNFVTAWPIDQMVSKGHFVNAKHSCLD